MLKTIVFKNTLTEFLVSLATNNVDYLKRCEGKCQCTKIQHFYGGVYKYDFIQHTLSFEIIRINPSFQIARAIHNVSNGNWRESEQVRTTVLINNSNEASCIPLKTNKYIYIYLFVIFLLLFVCAILRLLLVPTKFSQKNY